MIFLHKRMVNDICMQDIPSQYTESNNAFYILNLLYFYFFSKFKGTKATFSSSIWLWYTLVVFDPIIRVHWRRTMIKKIFKTHNFKHFWMNLEITFFFLFRKEQSTWRWFCWILLQIVCENKEKLKNIFWPFFIIFAFLSSRKRQTFFITLKVE